jgi:molybdenum cofactor cytidylyltransferase
MIISGVLLAAGESRRMGKNKLLLPYGNRTVIEESVFQLSRSDVDEVVVITGYQHDKVKIKIENRFKDEIKIVYNENYRSGRSESIRCAVNGLDEKFDAVLFMVADKPSVKTVLINRAITKYKKDTPLLLYVRTPGGRGHPVIFSRKIFGDLLDLAGEPAGDIIFDKYSDNTLVIDDDKDQIDIDTPEDYRRILETAVK